MPSGYPTEHTARLRRCSHGIITAFLPPMRFLHPTIPHSPGHYLFLTLRNKYLPSIFREELSKGEIDLVARGNEITSHIIIVRLCAAHEPTSLDFRVKATIVPIPQQSNLRVVQCSTSPSDFLRGPGSIEKRLSRLRASFIAQRFQLPCGFSSG